MAILGLECRQRAGYAPFSRFRGSLKNFWLGTPASYGNERIQRHFHESVPRTGTGMKKRISRQSWVQANVCCIQASDERAIPDDSRMDPWAALKALIISHGITQHELRVAFNRHDQSAQEEILAFVRGRIR